MAIRAQNSEVPSHWADILNFQVTISYSHGTPYVKHYFLSINTDPSKCLSATAVSVLTCQSEGPFFYFAFKRSFLD